MSKFKPLLAATMKEESFEKIDFPILTSPKLDGIRVIIREGQAFTRSLKPVRNKQVQHILGKMNHCGLDGEIIVGDPTDPLAFRNTTSGVMAEGGETDFVYHVFDHFLLNNFGGHDTFQARYYHLIDRLAINPNPRIRLVKHDVIDNIDELIAKEEEYLSAGYEGLMGRSMEGTYKYGRSTLNQGILWKLKRGVLSEGEGVIIDFVEQLKNMNEKITNELGYSQRSSHKENMVLQDTLGKLMVQCPEWDTPVKVGTGFTDVDRAEMWNNKTKYLGQTVKFEYMTYGGYDKPRQASYKGIRAPEDIS